LTTTTHMRDASDIERQIADLRDEIMRLKTRRRELIQRINAAGGGHSRRKGWRMGCSAGTYHATTHALETERDRVDERIATLEASARSIQDRSQHAPGTSVQPAVIVDQNGTQAADQFQGEGTMIRASRLAQNGMYKKWNLMPQIARSRLIWTIGNTLMLTGVVLLLYVGGVYAQAEYDTYAARGDTDVPAPRAVADPAPYEPAPFTAPNLGGAAAEADGQVRGAVPDATRAAHRSTITRVSIPSIGVDSKVVEVGWDVKQQNGQDFAIWQVAEYAVGQHRGSANPGEGDNIVLAGHVGGYGKVFKNLFYTNPGDQITLYNGDQQYLYVVQERLLLTEEGVSAEQQAANAQYIAPTGREVVTLVTCWPPKGADRFTQRVVVRAVPFGTTAAPRQSLSRWTLR
jgi:sortase A